MRMWLVVGVVTLAPLLTADARPEDPKRKPVPAEDDQAKAEGTARDLLKAEYAQRGAQAQAALAAKLLKLARETEDDPALRFVLFRESAAAAQRAGQFAAAFKAIDAAAAEYDVNAVDWKVKLLAAVPGELSPKAARELAEAALTVLDQAVLADDHAAALRVAATAEAIARKARLAELIARAQARAKEVREIQERFPAVQTARETLKTSPDDAQANYEVGRHLSLVKGDWAAGLPLLAKGADPGLKAAAVLDQKNPSSAAEQVAVADEWFAQTSKETGDARKNCQARAKYWYDRAVHQATGVTRLRAEQRLELLSARNGVTQTRLVGGSGGGPFEDHPGQDVYLVGVAVTVANYGEGDFLKSLRPVYAVGRAVKPGRTYGEPVGGETTLVAKPGYAVGGLVLRGTNGLKVVFMRKLARGLDLKDSYESPWVGGRGGDEERLGGNGRLVVGIHGRYGANLDAIGLLQAAE